MPEISNSLLILPNSWMNLLFHNEIGSKKSKVPYFFFLCWWLLLWFAFYKEITINDLVLRKFKILKLFVNKWSAYKTSMICKINNVFFLTEGEFYSSNRICKSASRIYLNSLSTTKFRTLSIFLFLSMLGFFNSIYFSINWVKSIWDT